ncbi:glucose-1-phosphate cytidylyltransferase [Ferrigenium kumadai]|uniref:Glucose-1-phosphate cytidylyltransferase n=1 Tax=Ferrigenium kumadai TaxID=1682490 RepID=A0AAN1T0T9_9PROT|nr:glucose-1-phosphate cytidylyltransferase [Ferrigenium kumadai]BBJ00649.1 glucose-1-phosphate cytidylyltransferase [Ferrigenium kumadai]
MKVVILCGGKGTRLREETEYRPKPMVPVGNHPILWHIMKIYAAHGHKEFILCLGYKGEVIKDWFRNLNWMTSDVRMTLGDSGKVHFYDTMEERDWTVTLADTGQETMTGGRIKRIEKYLDGDEEFLLTYGDGLGSVDITASIEYHRLHNRVLTLTGVRPPGRWGELKVTDGHVTNFFEKPQTSSGMVNGGFFVANRKLFTYLNDDPMLVFEQNPLNTLAREGELGCYAHDGFWQPMDTYQEFMLLNKMWNEGRAEWKIW